ncbi:hypothetical protein AA0472_1582 [Acetobacter estunensis NRIC 0472]|uniref:FAD assembly factor SdhE n=1 Tax=Acetobacter estunensis TaxID=104097 RepID=A0A967B3Q6_9PROT|nr:succinate dehydrogenase assembly factor 2 [Acetobacter estunensis]NHO53172.1 succinate dehydrogenase assembly factor 2 [Acetobacter estunensis]GBQ24919.1 hypothetical protein AA0472_1582 [Acetobacter estunensis NRIC 0472]
MEQNENASSAQTGNDHAESLEARRRRLIFRAQHRGTFETDILIGGFVDRHVNGMNAEQVADMEHVLQLPDPDLTDWLFGRLSIPEEKKTPMLVALVDDALTRMGKKEATA